MKKFVAVVLMSVAFNASAFEIKWNDVKEFAVASTKQAAKVSCAASDSLAAHKEMASMKASAFAEVEKVVPAALGGKEISAQKTAQQGIAIVTGTTSVVLSAGCLL